MFSFQLKVLLVCALSGALCVMVASEQDMGSDANPRKGRNAATGAPPDFTTPLDSPRPEALAALVLLSAAVILTLYLAGRQYQRNNTARGTELQLNEVIVETVTGKLIRLDLEMEYA